MFLDVKQMTYAATAIDGHDEYLLLAHAKRLKQSDGEGWAIGELVERIVAAKRPSPPASPFVTDDDNTDYLTP